MAWTVLHVSWQTRGKTVRMEAPVAILRVWEPIPHIQPSGPVSVNTASPDELRRLPGIGAVLAEAIIAERETHGRFFFPEDLLNVRGIGQKKLAGLWDHISLE